MRYVYGPIPSRRLGRSLGVDPIPLKTCNWNCVYCQLGRTQPLSNERRSYVPAAAVVAEVQAALAAHAPGEIDFISFVGSGEPTLHSGLGAMIRAVKKCTPIPVAVITNGALLHLGDVRAGLLAADVVMPTLSAGSAALHRAIHRPHPDATFARHVEGLVRFRAEYAGKLWVEVMLIAGLNDGDAALADLAALLARVQPDQVHLTLPDRPASERWVEPPGDEGLMRATAILGGVAQVVHPTGGGFDLRGHASLLDAVLAILARHPMSEAQLGAALAEHAAEADAVHAALAGGGARLVERHGTRFWTTAEQRFGNGAGAPRPVPAVPQLSLHAAAGDG
jgi:wyosine [tRNA(Phe)-imidazoG37] synthetase (radical SAM superfamily)